MLHYRTTSQPQERYVDFLVDLALRERFSRYDAAFAYATWTGVDAFLKAFENVPLYSKARKRWLISIDWCRSDPAALEILDQVPSSKVKVVNGSYLSSKVGCRPVVPFHPKTLILRGKNSIAVAAGSGNLSLNGMTKGHEVGTGMLVSGASGAIERELERQCRDLASWYEAEWRRATPLVHVLNDYRRTYKAAVKKSMPVTDDDSLPRERGGKNGAAYARVPALRSSTKLWVAAGNLHKNRGPGKPGNQLMLSRMTRVFFGAPAIEVTTDTDIGEFVVRYGSFQKPCPMRFSNNSMDVLTLPIPVSEGPSKYDQEVLCFTRRVENGTVLFDLSIGTPTDVTKWEKQSQAAGTRWFMSGTNRRPWGVIP